MNINDLAAARLLGDVNAGEVRQINGDTFVQIKDLVLRDDGISVTTMGGLSVPVSMASSPTLSKVLGGGGMFIINLDQAYIKVSAI